MLDLSTLGLVHTAISLLAVAAAAYALARHKLIDPARRSGRTYIWATVLTCLTGFGIFRHGGFGPPHVLGVITLLVLMLVAVAVRTELFGRLSRYVTTVALTTTVFLHTIPGLTETFTRLPLGAPLFSSPEDPALQKAVAVSFLIFLIGVVLQVRWLRASPARFATGRPVLS